MRFPAAMLAVLLLGSCSFSRPAIRAPRPPARGGSGAPAVLFSDAGALLAAQSDARAGANTAVLAQLRTAAERALRAGPFTVTDKPQLPPSGDKHDYMSLGRYWWPNPNTPNGLPYVQIDGKVNPETETIPDKKQLGELLAAVNTLSHAYYVFGDERYAEHAARLLRGWFLDPATRMNPNLEYSQIHKGKKMLGGSGIIDAREFALLPDAIALIEGSPAWTAVDDEGLRKWFAQYLDWLLTSPGGRKEESANNNHKTFYWYQALPLALYTGQASLVDRTLRTVLVPALDAQIMPDGAQPRELKRTKPFSYSVFNLMAWTRLAQLAQSRGIDLWTHVGAGGAGQLRQAIAYLLPYATGQQPIVDNPREPDRVKDFAPVLNRSALALRDPAWEALAKQLVGGDAAVLAYDLIVPTPTR